MTDHDEKRTRQLFTDLVAPHLITQASDIKQTNIALDKIEKHLATLNGNILRHSEAINSLEKEGIKHPIECSAFTKIAMIERDLAEYRLFKKYPKAGITVLLIALVLVGMNVFDLYQKVVIKKDTEVVRVLDRIEHKELVGEYQRLLKKIDSLNNR